MVKQTLCLWRDCLWLELDSQGTTDFMSTARSLQERDRSTVIQTLCL